MKKRILYSILNEWRDEDIEDLPIDLDNMDFEPTSSGMDNEPDLDDDFALSTSHLQYEYFPKTKGELEEIVKMEIEKQGGVDVNLNMIDTSKITNMGFMFGFCESLETLDVSKWNVSSVTLMLNMFKGCKSLKTLNVRGWNVSKVDNMFDMFEGCKSLKTIDVSGWDVSRVEDMSAMFKGCESLETLDVSGWDVSKVNDMSHMFEGCKSLKTLDVSGWNMSKVRCVSSIFKDCTSLHTDTTMWEINTSYIAEMYDNAPNIRYKK